MVSNSGRRATAGVVVAGLVAALIAAACGADSGVTAHRWEPLAETPPTTDESASTTAAPTTDAPPTSPEPPPSTVEPLELQPGEIFVGVHGKPSRPHDEIMNAAVVDLERWWSQTYPEIYGEPYEPLRGGVHPVWPGRTEPIPGCVPGEGPMSPSAAQDNAFYCAGGGDYIAYDESDSSFLMILVVQLANPWVFPVMLSHEWGHAIQYRNGDVGVHAAHTTILTEQQADCFAGAWMGRVMDGEAEGLTITHSDLRGALSALIAIRDQGLQETGEVSHGAGFDRVNAFQEGFFDGAERCSELLDAPLDRSPSYLSPEGSPGGNAPWGYGPQQILGMLPDDLNEYWSDYLGGDFPQLELVAVDGLNQVDCADPAGEVDGIAVYCPGTNDVYFDETAAQTELYEVFGDFSLGFVLGHVWAEVAQQQLDSPLEGKDRVLLNDCLAGAYAADITPDQQGQTPRGTAIEAGDLDEAIQAAIMLSDADPGDNRHGTAFEKVDHYRDGALNGSEACNERLTGDGN